jgi:signal transduction histidine kinase/CheY-like chemotaxis protein
MQEPRIPGTEEARLALVHALKVLDTEDEARFDVLARLASSLLRTQHALLTLLDRDRAWFKARVGVSVRQAPRALSFCSHVIAEGATIAVANSQHDPRFEGNPLGLGADGALYYISAPLRVSGHPVGTLCVYDTGARDVDPTSVEVLDILANQAQFLLQHRLNGLALGEATDTPGHIEREREFTLIESAIRTAYDALEAAALLLTPDGRVMAMTSAAEPIVERALGAPAATLLGRPLNALRALNTDGRPLAAGAWPHDISASLRRPLVHALIGLQARDDTAPPSWVDVSAWAMVTDDGGPPPVLVSLRDITEERALEQRFVHLARHERLVTTGTLAAGIGHEINNPLTYILANISMAMEDLQELGTTGSALIPEVIAALADAREGAERIRNVVRGLRALGREAGAIGPTDLHECIEVALSSLRHELRKRCTVVTDLGPPRTVIADEARLTQVLVSLLLNAGQAFATPDESRNRVEVRVRERPSGDVVVSVSDNGPGIDPRIVSRIFDPFFTTRPPGMGTGLGLAISHGQVEAMGGQLECSSILGAGATFDLTLPAVTTVTTPSRPNAGRVMVIDADHAVLATIGRMLERTHEVRLFSDSRAALDALRADPSWDAVVCDVLMPTLSGMQLYDRLVDQRAPAAGRFVFITGDPTRADVAAFLERERQPWLEKPFDASDLADEVQRLVDRARDGTA